MKSLENRRKNFHNLLIFVSLSVGVSKTTILLPYEIENEVIPLKTSISPSPVHLPTIVTHKLPSAPFNKPNIPPSFDYLPSELLKSPSSSKLEKSISPTLLWPQNTCYFTENSIQEFCNDSIISSSDKEEREIPIGDFLCSPNKRYRFGITIDKFICLCDDIEKVWCAVDANLYLTRDPYLQLRRNGCLAAYTDLLLIGKRKVWQTSINNNMVVDKNQSTDKDVKLIRKREEIVTKLQISDSGELSIRDLENPSLSLWSPNLDEYEPYYPPTPEPTISRVPTENPTTSPAPTTSYKPSSKPTQVTFNPGELFLHSTLDLYLSEGLSARLIGQTGSDVRYANGLFSEIPVHDQPDAGGCFDQPDGGWIYVSNSEMPENGGVGAFEFNQYGDLLNYQMIQTDSKMNCGGGKSPWGTWFSGEEYPKGGMWEVDVTGLGARKTNFGIGKFESAVCDDRDMTMLTCFATLDEENESLRRYRPNSAVLNYAVSNNNFSNVMHSPGGDLSYLVLNPQKRTYSWTYNKNKADNSAKSHFPNLEGIDHHDGKLYFVSKMLRKLYILDLDSNTYEDSSTEEGAFTAQPDQIVHLISDDRNDSGNSAFLYFLEDGGSTPGVFARNLRNNKLFTILEKNVDEFKGDEATGLAFCDNFRRLIIAFQERGVIYEVTREDGLPFYGATINVKHHREHFSTDKKNQRFSMSMDS